MKGEIYLKVALRSGGEIVANGVDISNEDDETIRKGIEGLAVMFTNIKKLEFLNLDCSDDGTCVVHPDDISHVYIVGTTNELWFTWSRMCAI